MLWALAAAVMVLWWVRRRRSLRRQRALAAQLRTGLAAWPILGHTHRFLGSDTKRMNSVQEIGKDSIKLGGVSKVYHLDQLIVSVADPVVAEILLKECLEKHEVMKILDIVIRNGSIIAPVHIWRLRRKAILPTFNARNLIQFAEIISKNTTSMVELLEGEADNGTFSFSNYISTCTFNNACETIMGVKMSADSETFLESMKQLWEIGGAVIGLPWYRYQLIRQLLPLGRRLHRNRTVVWQFIRKVIAEKRKLLQEQIVRTQSDKNVITENTSFLGRLLKVSEDRRFSDEELLEECVTLLIAGSDSSATAAAFVVLLLGRHLDVQDKVFEELQQVLGESERPVTQEDLRQLQYLDAVIKETLRLYPIAPLIVRHVDKDVKLPSGLTVVSGCGVFINIWAVHRHPGYWGEDADLFRPERFLDTALTHPTAFMPFSFGPRNCIGYQYAMMSLKIVLTSILRRYRVLPPPGVPQGEPLRTGFNLIIDHADNCLIRLERRK